MIDRGFSEVDLRLMMQHATKIYVDHEPDRWVIKTEHHAEPWEIIVEPDNAEQLLIIITAYQVGSS
jgi:hypothetical protein